MKHYYQTTPLESDEALLEATGRAISQEDRIYLVMRKYSPASYTAWELKEWFRDFEITSIRRSLFNLQKQGRITQIGFTPGPKGKPVGKYIAFTGKLF